MHCQLFKLSIFNTFATFALAVADTMATHAPLGPSPGEAILECAKATLRSHARGNGDGISVMSSRDSRTLYGCAKDEDEADHEALFLAIVEG